MAVSLGKLVARNWSTTPRAVTISFFVVFISLSALLAVAFKSEYSGTIYFRDHGVKSLGIVTGKYIYNRRNEYYLDYKYCQSCAAGGGIKWVFARQREVSRENYQRYDVGARIPIKYDPRDASISHLDVQGYWSNSRLALSSILKFILFDVQLGAAIGAFWLLAGLMYRMFFAPAKGVSAERGL